MKRNPIICVDFDGTIADYSNGWKGVGEFGDPIEGAVATLKYLKARKWTIIIFSCRGEVGLMEEYLHKHGVPFDYINENPNMPEGTNKGKPVADVYLDDRAIHFNGDWSWVLPDILALGEGE